MKIKSSIETDIMLAKTKFLIVIFLYFLKKSTSIFCFFLEKATASVFYVNNSTGDDNNNGLSPLTPFKTIDKLNTLLF